MLVPFLSGLVALAQVAPPHDGLVAFESLEATTSAEEPAEWVAVPIDGSRGSTPWVRARASFQLGDGIAKGDWVLAVGGSEHASSAAINGFELWPLPDPLAAVPALRAGPRFTVPSTLLIAGTNRLELRFEGERLGTELERGPAWLAGPRAAGRIASDAPAGALSVPIANFATLATASESRGLLERVSFKLGATGEPRLAASVDVVVGSPAETKGIAVGDLADRRTTAAFPIGSIEAKDERLPGFHGRLLAWSPVLTEPLRFSDAKLVLLEIGQITQRESFEFIWEVRLLPAIGGPLRVARENGFLLVRNEFVGVFAAEGSVLGDEAQPEGIAVTLNHETKPGTLRALAGPSVLCGVVGFERRGDLSQATTMADLVAAAIAAAESEASARGDFGSALASEPRSKADAGGIGSRCAVVSALAGSRRRDRRFVFAPAAGGQSAEAFWSDTSTLLHFPTHERGTVEWLLSTQDEAGAIRGDLPEGASERELAAADAYAVLRACRWLRWTYDGDRFTGMAPQLARALEHADRCELFGPAPAAGPERLSAVHVALARAAAHRELAAALEQLGELPEASAASANAATNQVDALLRPVEQGGRWGGSGFAEDAEDDRRDAAIGLAFGLIEGDRERALADAARAAIPAGAVPDWRDAVVLRALLERGFTRGLDDDWSGLEAAAIEPSRWNDSSTAAFHGALVFGLLGVRRGDYGSLELRPHLSAKQSVRTCIRLPEGPVRFQVLAPSRSSLERQVIVQNESATDLLVTVGIPGGIGSGRREKRGDLVHTLYERLIAPRETWREQLR